jgi:uncharacterized protein YegL
MSDPTATPPTPDHCEVIVLLDRSGSMSSIKKDMEGGYNSFVATQRAVPGTCAVTLVQFDSHGIDTVYESTPVADVPNLTLDPRGSTPLLDAFGQTLTRSIARGITGRVLFLVITDGQENASTEFKKEQIKALVEQQTKAGWAFSFLGANVDAFSEASALGITNSATSNFSADSKGVEASFVAMSNSLRAYRGGNDYELTDEQRKNMGGGTNKPAA